MNIRQKLIVFILSATVVLSSATIGYISVKARNMAYTDATELTNTYSEQYAAMVQSWLNSDMAISRTLASALQEYKVLPFEEWKTLVLGMYKRVMIANDQVDAIWDSWELSNLDPTWNKPHGRWLLINYRENGVIKSKAELRSLDGDPVVYGKLKAAEAESIVEPYASALQTNGLMTSLVVPMFEKGKFIGLVGVDLFLGRLQALVCGITPYENSFAFLISNEGNYIAHPDTAFFSKNIADVSPELNEKHKITERVKKGERFNISEKNDSGEEFYYAFSPINVGNTSTPWSLGIAVPVNTVMAEANKNFNISIFAGVIAVLLIIIVVVLLTNSIINPLKKITNLLKSLAHGKIDHSMKIALDTGDEIAEMAQALTQSIEGLNKKAEFAAKIGSNELETELALLSEDDVLGKSLIDMRDNLRKAKSEEAARKAEDEKRTWINEGLARFGDILRQNNDNMSKLGDEIIKNLVWYLKANQGGFFVKQEKRGKPVFNMEAAFAYDRKRYQNKTFELSEGLIGTCAAEKDTIHLTEIPADYIEITSGLGGSNPNNLLLVPLKIEEDVLGVIEIASFNKFQKHEIEFVESLASSIASTIRSVLINAKTNELLTKSQEQAEIMAAQEEEMRQNMEELQATQEEAARKAQETEGLITALNTSAFVVEYDLQGFVTNINNGFLDLLGISKDLVIGTHHTEGISLSAEEKSTYDRFWADLRKGVVKKQKTKVAYNNKHYILLETYTPVRDQFGEVSKILKIAIDITELSN